MKERRGFFFEIVRLLGVNNEVGRKEWRFVCVGVGGMCCNEPLFYSFIGFKAIS